MIVSIISHYSIPNFQLDHRNITDMYPMIWQYLIILIFHFDHFIATLCRIMPHYAILCHFDTAYELSHTHIYIHLSLSRSLSLSPSLARIFPPENPPHWATPLAAPWASAAPAQAAAASAAVALTARVPCLAPEWRCARCYRRSSGPIGTRVAMVFMSFEYVETSKKVGFDLKEKGKLEFWNVT